mmetsp:Transcript_41785/g.97581  ORF Transcript_41785/g.97581 Transcript_41785/m.97581 type:complete len:125 (-) Transcript_41785:30-404(-)
MGCVAVNAAPVETTTTKKKALLAKHTFDYDLTAGIIKEEMLHGEKGSPPAISSWDLRVDPSDRNRIMPPTRRTHEAHLRSLDDFLHRIESAPETLSSKVSSARRRDDKLRGPEPDDDPFVFVSL